MEVLATASHEEFITKVKNVEDQCYAPTIPKLPLKGNEAVQEGGYGICKKTQGSVEPDPEQTLVDSTHQSPCSNALSLGEAAVKNTTMERKCFKHYK